MPDEKRLKLAAQAEESRHSRRGYHSQIWDQKSAEDSARDYRRFVTELTQVGEGDVERSLHKAR